MEGNAAALLGLVELPAETAEDASPHPLSGQVAPVPLAPAQASERPLLPAPSMSPAVLAGAVAAELGEPAPVKPDPVLFQRCGLVSLADLKRERDHGIEAPPAAPGPGKFKGTCSLCGGALACEVDAAGEITSLTCARRNCSKAEIIAGRFL